MLVPAALPLPTAHALCQQPPPPVDFCPFKGWGREDLYHDPRALLGADTFS